MAPPTLTPAVLFAIVNAPSGFPDVGYVIGAGFDPNVRTTWIVRRASDGTLHAGATAWLRDASRTNADLLGLFVQVKQAARRQRVAAANAPLMALADATYDLVAGGTATIDRATFKSKIADYYVNATTTEDDTP